MTPTYIGDIDLNEETLAHFGVKGMKWGKRKARLKGKALELRAKYKRKLKGIKKDEATWDIKTGKSRLPKDDGKNRSTTRPTGNKTDFDYYQKTGGDYGARKRPSSSNNGYSDRSINSNFKYSPSSSTYDTNKNYKRNSDGSLSYSKKLYPTKSGGKTNTSGQTTKWQPETRSERQAYTYSKTVNNKELKKKAPVIVSKSSKTGRYQSMNTNAQNFLGADYHDVKKGAYGRHSSGIWESEQGLYSTHNPANKKKKKK